MAPASCWSRLRSEPVDAARNVSEQGARNGELRHLECDVTTMAHDLAADLDQLVPERSQRPLLDGVRQRRSAQEVAEIVGERMQLQPDGVVGELAAREPRPVDRGLALLDALLCACPSSGLSITAFGALSGSLANRRSGQPDGVGYLVSAAPFLNHHLEPFDGEGDLPCHIEMRNARAVVQFVDHIECERLSIGTGEDELLHEAEVADDKDLDQARDHWRFIAHFDEVLAAIEHGP